jgi:hypothetical protein
MNGPSLTIRDSCYRIITAADLIGTNDRTDRNVWKDFFFWLGFGIIPFFGTICSFVQGLSGLD